jgi:hypothetical protein
MTAETPTETLLTESDCTLLNLKALAGKLNVSYDFVKDMRKMGFEMPFGGLTTLTHALHWLNTHLDFRERARLLKLARPRGRRARLQLLDAGKSGESRSMRDSQSFSPCSRESLHELAA